MGFLLRRQLKKLDEKSQSRIKLESAFLFAAFLFDDFARKKKRSSVREGWERGKVHSEAYADEREEGHFDSRSHAHTSYPATTYPRFRIELHGGMGRGENLATVSKPVHPTFWLAQELHPKNADSFGGGAILLPWSIWEAVKKETRRTVPPHAAYSQPKKKAL